MENNIETKKIYVGHFYGYDKTIYDKTGYAHCTEIKDESLQSVVNTILNAGLNVMVLQHCEAITVYISKDKFRQM